MAIPVESVQVGAAAMIANKVERIRPSIPPKEMLLYSPSQINAPGHLFHFKSRASADQV
jgi:hypothetical protein